MTEKRRRRVLAALKGRTLSFGFALKGWKAFFSTQIHARIHAFCTVGVIAGGFYFGLNRIEWCIIILCIGLVFVTEALNTVLEFFLDFVHPGFHEKVGRMKDISAGAVLFSALTTFVIGLLIFGGKIYERWF